MALKFDITGDNRNLLNALDGARNGVHRAAQDIEKSGIGIEEMFKRIAAAAGIAFSMEGAKSFLTKVVEMRSYFQDIESSMQVFLGNEEKAAKFMKELKAAAYYNMFEFTDLANASKQLIAYKNDIDTVIPTIQKLSDIAVGTSANLDELVHLYNKAKSTGRVSTQDLYSWATKGVVLKDVLKDMGEEASNTSVTFEQLNKVLDSLTSEGGMFYQQQEKMMNNISAEIGQFEDNLALMLNEIGEKYQDQITGAIKLGSELIDNYQVIAGWIKDIVIAYGTYRAVLATCLAIDKAVVYWKGLQAEATMMNTLANTSETGSVTALTIAKLRLTAATKALTAAILDNPYVIVAAGVATLTYAIYKLATTETDLEKAQKKVDEAFEDTLAEMKSEQTEIDRLFGKLKKAKEGTEEYKKVKDQILGQYGSYLQGLSNEISTLKDVEGAYKAVTKAARDASIARGKEAALKDVQDTYGSNYASSMGNLQAALNSRVGGEKAANALKLIQSELQKTGTISTETEKKVRELFRGTADYGNSGAWITGLRNNEKMLADHTKLVEERFQTEEEEEKEHVEEKKVRNKQAIEEEKKNLQTQLDNLSKEEAIGKKGIDLKKKIKALEKELKAYNASDKSGKSGKDHTAEQDATRRQKLFEQDMAAEESQSRQKRELRDALHELEIASEEDNAKRELMQMQKDHEDKLAAIREQADQWKKEAYKAAEERWNATNKDKAKTFADTDEGKAGWQAQSLTPEQEQTIQARVDAENAIYNRGTKERLEVEKQHMLDYLKEYGNISQKKQAIAEEYDKKIAKAQDKWQKKSLEQEKKKAQNAIDIEVLKTEIDWTMMFDGIGKALEGEMKSTLKNIEEYMKTAEFKALSFEEKTSLVNMRNKLIQQTSGGVGTFDFSIYGKIAEDTEAYQKAMLAHKIAIENQILAEEELTAAKKELEEAEEELAKAEGDDAKKVKAGERIKAAKNAVNAAQNQVTATQVQVQNSETQVANTQGDLITSTTQAQQAIDGFSNAMSEMTNGTLHGFANGLVKLIQAITGSEQSGLSGLGKAGGLIGAILSIIDALGEDPGGRISDIIDKIFNVFTGITEQVGNGQFLGKIVKSILEGISKLISQIFENTWKDTERAFTFNGPYGGLSDSLLGIFGLAEKDEDLKRKRERLADSLDSSAYAVDHFTKELDKATGVMAMTFGDELRETILKQMGVIVQGIDATLWDDYGGHHSDYYHFNKNQDMFYAMMPYMNRYGINAYEEGQGHYTWQEIMRNNPEQLAAMFKDIQAHDPDLWNKITKEAGYNDGNLEEWLDKLIEAYDKLGEAADRTNEKLTSISYDSLESDFLNSLYDMADGSEDVFDDIEKRYQKMLNRMIVDNLVFGEDFQTKLKKWYEDLAQLQRERNGTADDFDQEAYEAERQRILDEIERLRNDDQKGKYIYDSPTPGSEYHREEIEALLAQLAELDRKAKEAQTGTQISDEEYQRRLEELKAQYQQWVAEGKDSVEFFREMGLIQAIDEAAEHFGDLRSKFLDTLMDMEFDAEEWKKELNKKLVQDLLEKQYFDVKMTVNGQDFDNFDAYAKDWNKRYLEALEAGDEAALQALIEELVQQRELLAEASEDLTSRLKEAVEDTTFKDMSDSWVSTLMDMNATAEDWAQNIGQIMVQKIVEQLIAPSMLQPLLDGLQGAFNTAMSADGATWDSVVGDAGVQEWLTKIRETFPEAQNIVRQIMESLGLITAEGLGNIKDNFVSALTDINKTAEDLGKDIANTMYSQMVDKFVDSKYGEELKRLSDEWAEALKSGDTAKIEELRQKIIALYETIGNDESIKQLLDDLNKLNTEAGSTPFDNLRSSYLSAVMDMEKTTKDFTKDIMNMIAEAFIDSFVLGTAFDEKLNQWKEEYRKITSDNSLSETERLRQLKSLGELIAGERDTMRTEANNIMTMLGLNQGGTDSATMNMADKATYDQFELYLGIANSQLMVSEQHKQIAQQILSHLESMNGITSPDSVSYGERIYTRLGTTNEYLLATKNYVRDILAEMDNIKQSLNRL